ncbi:hypothetical protein SAMN04515647_2168 [Cohaesibacter sp. ES.047]|nr:hypothetical protein SAMN04515647_2168 [Cohaesibacter sp. ES.047]
MSLPEVFYQAWMNVWPMAAWLACLMVALYCRTRSWIRWFLLAHALVLLVAIPGSGWIGFYMTHANCTGSMLKGVRCPEETMWAKLIYYHSVLWFYSWLYTLAPLPFLLLTSTLVEFSMRRSVNRRHQETT